MPTMSRKRNGARLAGLHLSMLLFATACPDCGGNPCPIVVWSAEGYSSAGAITPDPRGETGALHGRVVLRVVSQTELGRDETKTLIRLEGISLQAEPVPSQGESVSVEMLPGIGWTIPDLVGQTLAFDRFGGYTDCVEQGGPGYSDEAMVFGFGSVRDSEGSLLMAGSYTPLPPGGQAFVDPGAIPELSLGWVDVGCTHIHGFASYAVAFTVRPKRAEDGTETLQAKPGERVRFMLGGKSYTMVVEQATGPSPDGKYCGGGSWLIYREDFLLPE